METEKSLIDMIHKHIKFEEDTAKTCADLREKVDSAAAKMLLTEMQLDTTKHAHIFRELLDTLEKTPPARLWDYRIASHIDSLVVKRALESHLNVELKMLREVEALIKATKDDALRLLLEHIAADEKKHHEIIQTILKKSYVLTK